MSDLQTLMAESAWRRLVERRRRRSRLRGVTFALLMLPILALVGFGIFQRDRLAKLSPLTVREIVILNNRTVDGSQVLDILGLRAGDPWWRYDPDAIRARAATNPRIARLDVQYVWFHQLHVEVAERRPTMAVVGDIEGELTGDGWFLPRHPMGEETDLPILRPARGKLPVLGSRADPQTSAVARLIGSLESDHVDLWRDLSEVEMGPQEARAYLRSRRGVILFSPGLHEELWGHLPALLGHLQRNRYCDVMLDLRFAGRIIVRFPGTSLSDTLITATPGGKA